jgi:acetyl-CoA acetyltransferase
MAAEDVDGLATFSIGDSSRTEEVAYALGIDGTCFNLDIYGGGNAAVQVVSQAMLAVEAGLCRAVLVYRSLNGRSGRRYGRSTDSEVSGVYQFGAPHGYLVPAQWFAMWAQRYLFEFGLPPTALGHVATTFRKHAQRNAHAVSRTALSMDDYVRGRWISEPFRVYDCARETDAAAALLVTTLDRARELRHHPIIALATAEHAGAGGYTDAWPDMTKMYSAYVAPCLWQKAGVTPADIDVACLYDCFSYTALVTTEDFGFCEKGEGADFYRRGDATYGGKVVINPHGGLLSEGYVHGINHHYEAVLQLRGQAGVRQVPDAELALVSAGVANWGGAIVYARA